MTHPSPTSRPGDEGKGSIGFNDWLPVRAEYIAPHEYKIVAQGGHSLFYIEGASLAEWICERINAGARAKDYEALRDAAMQYLEAETEYHKAHLKGKAGIGKIAKASEAEHKLRQLLEQTP
jgi:hypothetical protein